MCLADPSVLRFVRSSSFLNLYPNVIFCDSLNDCSSEFFTFGFFTESLKHAEEEWTIFKSYFDVYRFFSYNLLFGFNLRLVLTTFRRLEEESIDSLKTGLVTLIVFLRIVVSYIAASFFELLPINYRELFFLIDSFRLLGLRYNRLPFDCKFGR